MESFLGKIPRLLKTMPDSRPKYVPETIRSKSEVVFYPVEVPGDDELEMDEMKEEDEPLHIVWPHRWEYDKNPKSFFDVLYRLQDNGIAFRVSVLGEQFAEIPEEFQEARERLDDDCVHQWGYCDSKNDYYGILKRADVVVSTSVHEFFGVAMLEAVAMGCFPLAPNRLVYPEFFPKENLFNTDTQLFKKLKRFCQRPDIVRELNGSQGGIDLTPFDWDQSLKEKFEHAIWGKEK